MSRLRLWPSRRAAPKAGAGDKPVLGVDVDAVVALFGFDEPPRLPGARFELVDGMLHFISFSAGERLQRLAEVFDPVWVTGWEHGIHRIEDLLALPGWPYLTFGGAARFGSADWKLKPLEEYAAGRPGSTTASTSSATAGPASGGSRPCWSRPNRNAASRMSTSTPSSAGHAASRRTPPPAAKRPEPYSAATRMCQVGSSGMS